jgi:hypothetical protein
MDEKARALEALNKLSDAHNELSDAYVKFSVAYDNVRRIIHEAQDDLLPLT